jgi:transcriptional regulator with XRE-family HTH domain
MAENKKTSAAQEFKEMLATAESQVDFKIDAAKAGAFGADLQRDGRSRNHRSRTRPAPRVSRAYVNKILKGTANLTIESQVRIAIALGREFLFQVATPENAARFASRSLLRATPGSGRNSRNRVPL